MNIGGVLESNLNSGREHGGDFCAAAFVFRPYAKSRKVASRSRLGHGKCALEVAAAAQTREVAQQQCVRLRRVAAARIRKRPHWQSHRTADGKLRLYLVGYVPILSEFRNDVRRELVLETVKADGMSCSRKSAQGGD